MMNYLIYGRAEPSRAEARQGKARQGKAGKHVLRSIYKDRLLVSPRRGLGRS